VKVRSVPSVLVAAAVAVTLAACSNANTGGAQQQGQRDTERAFKQQAAAVPYPVADLTDSLERRDISAHLRKTNKPNAIGYLYLFPPMGATPIGYYVIKGKVTSTQSQMTTDQMIVWSCPNNEDSCSRGEMQASVVNAPGDDGSYGANEPGYYFTLAEGTTVTTDLHYVLSDNPLPIEVPRLNATKG